MKNKTNFFKFVFVVKMLFFTCFFASGQAILDLAPHNVEEPHPLVEDSKKHNNPLLSYPHEIGKWVTYNQAINIGNNVIHLSSGAGGVRKAFFNSLALTKDAKTITFDLKFTERGDDGGNFMTYLGHGYPGHDSDEVFTKMAYFGAIRISKLGGGTLWTTTLDFSHFANPNGAGGAILSKELTGKFPYGTSINTSGAVNSLSVYNNSVWSARKGFNTYRVVINVKALTQADILAGRDYNSYFGFGFRGSPGEPSVPSTDPNYKNQLRARRNSKWEISNVSVIVNERPEAMQPVVKRAESVEKVTSEKITTEVKVCPCTTNYDLMEHTTVHDFMGTYKYSWFKKYEHGGLSDEISKTIEEETKKGQFLVKLDPAKQKETFYLRTSNGLGDVHAEKPTSLTIIKDMASCTGLTDTKVMFPYKYQCADASKAKHSFDVKFEGGVGNKINYAVEISKGTETETTEGSITLDAKGKYTLTLSTDKVKVSESRVRVKLILKEGADDCNFPYNYIGYEKDTETATDDFKEFGQGAQLEKSLYLYPEPDTSVYFYQGESDLNPVKIKSEERGNQTKKEIIYSACESNSPSHILVNPKNEVNSSLNGVCWLKVISKLEGKTAQGETVSHTETTTENQKGMLKLLSSGERLQEGEYTLTLDFYSCHYPEDERLICSRSVKYPIKVHKTPEKPKVGENLSYCSSESPFPVELTTKVQSPTGVIIKWYLEKEDKTLELIEPSTDGKYYAQKDGNYYARAVIERTVSGEKFFCPSEKSDVVKIEKLPDPDTPEVTIKDNKTKISVKKDGYYVITGTPNSKVTYTIAGGSPETGTLNAQGKLEVKVPTQTTGDKEIIITEVKRSDDSCPKAVNVKASVKVVAASAYINPNLRLRVKQP